MIKVGAKVQQSNGRIRTIVEDLKMPLAENPGQKMPQAHEVMLQTVLNNPGMFKVL